MMSFGLLLSQLIGMAFILTVFAPIYFLICCPLLLIGMLLNEAIYDEPFRLWDLLRTPREWITSGKLFDWVAVCNPQEVFRPLNAEERKLENDRRWERIADLEPTVPTVWSVRRQNILKGKKNG